MESKEKQKDTKGAIDFYLDTRSGVAPYRQIIQQVKQALRLRYLKPGDRLPTVRDVTAKIAINPNTVFKAYRELEIGGFVESRPGVGTFVTWSFKALQTEDYEELNENLSLWIQKAYDSGLDKEIITALLMQALQRVQRNTQEDIA